MNIMRRVPGSVLWLLRLPREAEANIRKETAKRGIDPSRIIMSSLFPKVKRVGHSICFVTQSV